MSGELFQGSFPLLVKLEVKELGARESSHKYANTESEDLKVLKMLPCRLVRSHRGSLCFPL